MLQLTNPLERQTLRLVWGEQSGLHQLLEARLLCLSLGVQDLQGFGEVLPT